MRLDALKIFARVAEQGSFTRAAESLGLPKATVSTAVRDLEAELGAQLLQRTTRRVGLTYDGQAFLDRTRDLLSDVDDLSGMFETAPGDLTGRVRADMTVNMAAHVVIPRLPEFLTRHPQIEVELSSTDRFVDVVREGFDCVVRVGPLPDSGLVARRLGVLEMANVASPAYLAAHGTPQMLEDLRDHRIVHYSLHLGAKPFGFEYPKGDGWAEIPMAGALTVNNTQSYTAAVLAGLGIIQAPRLGVGPHLKSGALKEILTDFPAEPLPVAILYPQRRHLPRRVRAFIDWLAEILAPHLTR